jgi:hypothetical protein
MGYDEASVLSASSNAQNSKKINLYNEFSQYLLGFTGSANTVRLFENDLLLDGTGSMKNVFIISLSRLLTKDQIKKGSVQLTLGTGSWATPFTATRTLYDAKAKVDGTDTTNTLGGDYGVLYTGSAGTGVGLGIVFYQAGIIVLTASAFSNLGGGGRGGTDGVPLAVQESFNFDVTTGSGQTYLSLAQSLTASSISGNCDAVRRRLLNVQFNNTTEINSTIYFCRAPHNKFNYSSNPTYLSGSKIRVKNVATDDPVSYITTIGLYNTANELLAIAKLSEPLRKDPQNELTVRVRLDY